MSRELTPGNPLLPGATWDGQGVNFTLFSAHADRVELCVFDEKGDIELERFELFPGADHIWSGYLADCGPGTIYGYRVYGCYAPEKGQRFNHHKLLLDPYAKQVTGTVSWHDSVFGFEIGNPLRDSSFDTRDSAGYVPKSVVIDETFDWQDDRPPHIPWAQTIIYETHVRGLTKLYPRIEETIRGSFAALGSTPVIAYLKSLGITSVELQPVHEFIDDHFLVEKNKTNYWGYNTLSYFAPASRYLASGDRNEFKTMVRRLHQAGIEIILDVVYNHTAEGDQNGPTLSFRGIDNTSYYRLPADNLCEYINDTGCGNTLNTNHPRVLQMVIDSLRYWVTEMHVDGFRFDLAVSLGREPQGFSSHNAFFKLIQQDAVLSQVKLIAEPWDIGPGGYQLGAFPADWTEWNDRFRDTVRRFWRGDTGLSSDFARCLHGSSELFEHNHRRPSASINLITSHDGFTLRDLVSYNERHNEANGESNHDGHGANFSYNHGVEGNTDDPEITSMRERQSRNLLATLFLAQGTPMLLAGDEFGNSQLGNNNAYCQDNELSWLDWSLLDTNTGLHGTVIALIALRKRYAVLHRNRYLHDSRIDWLKPDGESMSGQDWHHPEHKFVAMLLSSAEFHVNQQVPDQATLILAFNAGANPICFDLPDYEHSWRCVFSTAAQATDDSALVSIMIESHSVYVFELSIGADS